MNQLNHVAILHAEWMHCVNNAMKLVHVDASQNIMVILTLNVDPNVFQILNVLRIVHVSIINVLIHVLELVVNLRYVALSIILQYVVVLKVTLAIL